MVRDDLDKQVLGQVVDLVSNIKVGGALAQATDVLGQVYEYFLEQFAIAEGRKGGEFYTPRSVVRLLVEMIEPFSGRVFDPCCGSAGMFVQSVKFIGAHATGNGNGKKALSNLSIYGQESNQTTLRLAKMNLAIRGIDAQIEFGDSFRNDRHPDLRADYILANPPFNVSDWNGDQLKDDKRWVHGIPPVGQRQLRLDTAFPPSPGTQRDSRVCAGKRVHVLQHVGRRRDTEEHRRSRTWWTASSPCQGSYSGRPRYRPACGSCPKTGAGGRTGPTRVRPCSSTPGRWATC